MSNVNLSDHIIICGWSETAEGIIEQLHGEGGDQRRQVVLIDPVLDSCPVDDPYVYFVKGDPTSDKTLERAHLKTACTAVVLADWSIADAGLRDAKSTLITLAIENHNRDVYSVVELMRSENRCHLTRANVDEAVCVADLSQRLLLHAALDHGLSRLFAELLAFDVGSEIYKVPAPPPLIGKTFRQLVQTISDDYQAILMAVERKQEIFCNPTQQFIIEPSDELFVIAKSYPHKLADFGKENSTQD